MITGSSLTNNFCPRERSLPGVPYEPDHAIPLDLWKVNYRENIDSQAWCNINLRFFPPLWAPEMKTWTRRGVKNAENLNYIPQTFPLTLIISQHFKWLMRVSRVEEMWMYQVCARRDVCRCRQRDRQERRFPSSVETHRGRDFRTSHIADTWRYAGMQCLYVCVCGQGERERRGKAFVSTTQICPRALWVITEKSSNSTNSASLKVTQL